MGAYRDAWAVVGAEVWRERSAAYLRSTCLQKPPPFLHLTQEHPPPSLSTGRRHIFSPAENCLRTNSPPSAIRPSRLFYLFPSARRRCATFHPKWGVSQRYPLPTPLTLLPEFAPRTAEKRIGRTDPVIQPDRQYPPPGNPSAESRSVSGWEESRRIQGEH